MIRLFDNLQIQNKKKKTPQNFVHLQNSSLSLSRIGREITSSRLLNGTKKFDSILIIQTYVLNKT